MMVRTPTVVCFTLMLISGFAYSADSADFADIDSNDDGKISKTEFSNMSKSGGRGGGIRSGGRRSGGSGGDRFSKVDTDGDGYLSPSEFSAAQANRGSRNKS